MRRRPRPDSSVPSSWASTSCSPSPTSSPSTCPRRPRRSASSRKRPLRRPSPRFAGAVIYFFTTAPTTESPLFEHESVVVTPHLGASTEEAQEKAGIAVARSVRLALGGELVPDAVNVSSGFIAEEVRPGIALVEKLGRIFTAIAGTVPAQLDVDVRGEITAHDVSVWKLVALKGLFTDVVEDPVTYVNAPVLAEQRGCVVRLVTDPDSGDFRNVTTLRGTLAGPKRVEKLVGVNGYDLEVPLSEHMLVFEYSDRPGVIGGVGRILGDAGINIGGMQVSRQDDRAIGVLNVDSAVPAALAAELSEVVEAKTFSVVDLHD